MDEKSVDYVDTIMLLNKKLMLMERENKVLNNMIKRLQDENLNFMRTFVELMEEKKAQEGKKK